MCVYESLLKTLSKVTLPLNSLVLFTARDPSLCSRDARRTHLERHLLVDVRHAELLQEALILTPEEADVGDVVEDHGQPLQPQPEGPADPVLSSGCSGEILEGDDYWDIMGEQFCEACIDKARQEAVYEEDDFEFCQVHLQ